MKEFRTRRSIAEKAIRAAEAIDRQPWSLVGFTVCCVAFLIISAIIYNGVVPAYQ